MSELFPAIDFVHFHEYGVPDLLSDHGALAGADVAGVEPIAIRVGDDAFTYVPDGGSLRLAEGDAEAATVAVLEPDVWTEFAHELRSCFGLMIGEIVSFDRGDFGGLMRWEPALRAVWHGRPVYDDAAVAAIADLDLARAFTPDQTDEIADFIDRAGFVHVRGVFSASEMEQAADEVERLKADATYNDNRSWWAKNSEGDDVCCRLIYAGERSEYLRALTGDDRIRKLVELTGADVRQRNDRLDGESVVIKNPDVVEGLSDLPWHRDCGMGGHPVICPGINVGIQLDPATEENGRLRFLAASHRSSSHMPSPKDLERLPVQGVTTERGDLTLHFGHVLHEAPPPNGHLGSLERGRRTQYSTWVNPLAFDVVEPGRGYNDSVLAKRGRVEL